MSAGNLIGSIFNTIFFGMLWVVLGMIVEKMFRAFNYSMTVLPTLQDAANGLTIMQTAWSVICVIIFLVIWINYTLNENSQASGGV